MRRIIGDMVRGISAGGRNMVREMMQGEEGGREMGTCLWKEVVV